MKQHQHPPLESIAAFIDHRLDQKESEPFMAHLANCDQCYEIYAGTIESQELSPDTSTQGYYQKLLAWLKSFQFPAWYLAAPAAIAIIIFFFFSTSTTSISPYSSQQVAEVLVHPSTSQELQKGFFVAGIQSQTFSDHRQAPQNVMKLGIWLIDLEVTLEIESREQTLVLVNEINSLLPQLDASPELMEAFQDMHRNLQRVAPLHQFKGITQQVEIFFDQHPSQIYLYLGQWTESLRLAAITGNISFFKDIAQPPFTSAFEASQLPQPAYDQLKQLEDLLKVNTMDELTLMKIQRLSGDIQQYLTQ